MDLLLLPGLLCDRAVWAPVLAELETAARCHIPDFADERSLAAMAERVLAGAPATFAMAGHSMGGRVALEIVRRAPARVERLALLDTGCRPLPTGAAGDEEGIRRHALLALAREEGMRAMAREWVRPMVHPARHADVAFIDTILDMFERHTPLQFQGQIEALLARPNAMALLPTITCPTLVLAGRADGWSTPAQHEEMAALIPGSRLAIIEDSGHMSPMERPASIAGEMLAWIARPSIERRVAHDAPHTTS